MTHYLLDTNIASCIIKGNSPAVDRRLVKVPMAQLGSSVTEGELRFGAARLPHAVRLHAMIEEFLLRVVIFPWDSRQPKNTASFVPISNARASPWATSMP